MSTPVHCRTCGASLSFSPGSRSATCDYCDTVTSLAGPDGQQASLMSKIISSDDVGKIQERIATLSSGECREKRLAAGLLAILLGSLGAHKFYLGYSGAGITMLLLSVLTCGAASVIVGMIGIIEGIIYLTTPAKQFQSIYIDGTKAWF